MDIKVDQKAIEREVTNHVIDWFMDEEKILDKIRNGLETRMDKVFAEKAEALVESVAENAFKSAFERSFQKTNGFGQAIGDPTTIKTELERMAGDYWSQKVGKDGKPTDSNYHATSRAEWMMAQICADDFSKLMKQSAQNVTGALKDGLRVNMANQMDSLLDNLFKIKSLQDQGKVEKPY